MKGAIKSLLPHGRTLRRLPVGIGRGLRMRVDFHAGDTQLFLGLYEAQLNRYLRALAKPGFRSFDLGGAYGYDALVMAKLTRGQVLSVECEAHLVAEIAANVKANPRLPQVTVRQGFVGEKDDGQNVTIDTLAAEHFVPDLMKLDIEGGEAAALLGATKVLAERQPAILLEVHGREIEWECLGILRDFGYAPPTVVERRRWIAEHRPMAHNRWLVFQAREDPAP